MGRASDGDIPATTDEQTDLNGRLSSDEDRNSSADDRDRTAEDRDQISAAYDLASDSRDDRADGRDARAEARDNAAARFDIGAASDRAGAWRDRRGGASDRRHAADDREAAATDRILSARERHVSSIDELTGAHRRAAGLVELTREVARAQRTKQPFVLAFIDVDGLKQTNDSIGHAAGDRLLCRVVNTLRANVRSYDLIVRFGGDEFLCALLDLDLAGAAERFSRINTSLAMDPHASISVGFAELEEQETVEELVNRADEALRRQRLERPSSRV